MCKRRPGVQCMMMKMMKMVVMEVAGGKMITLAMVMAIIQTHALFANISWASPRISA